MQKKSDELIELEGIRVEILRSSKRKTLSLEVGQRGVIARAPTRMLKNTIKRFILSKRGWIEKNLNSLPIQPPRLKLEENCQLLLLDRVYHLHVSSGQTPAYINDTQQLVVPVSNRSKSFDDALHNKLIKWYKQTALKHISQRVSHYSSRMLAQGSPSQIKVREYKRRWGSCNHRGDISFNWRIIMAPVSVVDYVVVHELAHLVEFNHSPEFWTIVEREMPNWREARDWLNQNGKLLYRL